MDPEQVISPIGRWELREVIHTGDDSHWSLARGDWKNKENQWEENVLAIRWNGAEGQRGFPGVGKYPLWFILPSELYEGVMSDVLRDQLQEKITQMVRTTNQEVICILPGDEDRIQIAVRGFVKENCHPRFEVEAPSLQDLPDRLKTAMYSISSAFLVSDEDLDPFCDQLAEWINAHYRGD